MARINEREDEVEAAVVLLRTLPGEVNKGYHSLSNWVVHSVNGERVRSLAHLVKQVESAEGDFLTFMDARGHRVVLDRTAAQSAGAEILRRYRIDRDRSRALMPFQVE